MIFLVSLKLVAVVFACFFISGLCQTVWLKSKTFNRFAYPLDFGLSFRDKRIFGDNKTFAVFIVMQQPAGNQLYRARMSGRYIGVWIAL